MKRLFLSCLLALGVLGGFANSYKLDEAAIENAFAASEDITWTAQDLNINSSAASFADQSTGGFLLRSFFCGFIALHRSYMGTGGKTLWYYYLCIPVLGGVANLVDFCGVLFKGDEFMAKYKDNPKFLVWTD
ncbi:MAG: hypothetical protein HN542_02955 [Flavobacteriales bacterium]|nr:hypothetical protein [Flavobacteriales bacterium]NCG30804.1 hypothetical protein [Bacteroidota bacterium]MBT3962683.1 hypothetical protein [Flavobacteriales bacterium]MBT4704181.1 hypothetical protein [Flavobacteriales bacterium]MBT4929999.1 hypothetical protein [Flavobacteriales bacterium]